jgi:hypothetical protein
MFSFCTLSERLPGLGAVRRIPTGFTKAAPPAIFLWAQLSENADHKYVKSMPSIRPAPRVLLGGPGWKTTKIAASNKLVITEGLRDAREQIIEALAV